MKYEHSVYTKARILFSSETLLNMWIKKIRDYVVEIQLTFSKKLINEWTVLHSSFQKKT